MALRVLLADNSETIKKVIQLTLQDFAIDLRVVTLGVDVLDVALQFKPDIIFVDILLQKKNGYEVSKELKNNVQLKSTPVILMWSGFMEFDEPKAKESLADARLEKPFDAETLKGLVTKLVKKDAPPDIASFLDFPGDAPTKATPPTAPPKSAKHEDPLKSLDKIKTEAEKFDPSKHLKPPVPGGPIQPVELPNLEPAISGFESKHTEDEFEMQPLDKTTGFGFRKTPESPLEGGSIHQQTKSFVLNLPDDTSSEEVPLEIEKIDNVEDMSFLLNPESVGGATKTHIPTAPKKVDRSSHPVKPQIPNAPMTPPVAAIPAKNSIDAPIPTLEDIERIVREEVREAIEKVVWQVVPEMATQIIKKELERLLGNENDQIK